MALAYRGTRETLMYAFAKLDLRENIAKKVKYLNVLDQNFPTMY